MIRTAAQILAEIGPDEEKPDRTKRDGVAGPGRPKLFSTCQNPKCPGEPTVNLNIVRGLGPRCYRKKLREISRAEAGYPPPAWQPRAITQFCPSPTCQGEYEGSMKLVRGLGPRCYRHMRYLKYGS